MTEEILVIKKSDLKQLFGELEESIVSRITGRLDSVTEADKKLLSIKSNLSIKQVAELLDCTPQNVSNLKAKGLNIQGSRGKQFVTPDDFKSFYTSFKKRATIL